MCVWDFNIYIQLACWPGESQDLQINITKYDRWHCHVDALKLKGVVVALDSANVKQMV